MVARGGCASGVRVNQECGLTTPAGVAVQSAAELKAGLDLLFAAAGTAEYSGKAAWTPAQIQRRCPVFAVRVDGVHVLPLIALDVHFMQAVHRSGEEWIFGEWPLVQFRGWGWVSDEGMKHRVDVEDIETSKLM